MRTHYFDNIHILRAIAALSVVVYHVIEILPWTRFPVSPVPMLWFRIGWMGVDLFFVISGFVIALSAMKLLQENPQGYWRSYVRHRAARILPLHYLTMIVIIVASGRAYLAQPDFVTHLLTHVFMVHNLDPATHGSINGANWSVGTEAQFYLLLLLCLPWLARANPWVILVGGVTSSWLYRGAVFALNATSDSGVQNLFVYSTQVFGMLDEFALGIFLARLVLDKGGAHSPFPHWMRSPWFWLAGATVVFGAMWRVYWLNAEYWNDWRMVVFFRTAIGASFFFMVGAAVFMRFPLPVRQYVLPPFLYLGEISYGIYLWHVAVISALKKAGVVDPAVFLSATMLGVIVLASLSWHFFERPFIRRFR